MVFTYEEPDSGVVGTETQDHMSVWSHKDSVSSHRCRGERSLCAVVRIERACLFLRAGDKLKGMPVEMERVFSRIVIIKNDLYHLVVVKDEGTGVVTVDKRVSSIGPGREDSIKCRHLGGNVSDPVEEGVIGPIIEVVHLHIKRNCVVDVGIDGFSVIRDECEIVELSIERVYRFCLRLWLSVVINKPSRYVWVQAVRNDVEEILYQLISHVELTTPGLNQPHP